jgi:putative hydrolase of the HAD superfamily
MLKAVTFDLWQTLIMETEGESRGTKAERLRRIEEVLRQEQITVDAEAINGAYQEVGKRLAELWLTLQDMGAYEQVGMLLDILNIAIDTRPSNSLMSRLVDAYTLPILSALPVPLDGAAGVLAALEGRGLRMAVICNTGRTPGKVLRIILDRLGLAKHLLVQTFSDELGLRKPHREIFERTLNSLRVKPQEALHVGDMLDADVFGARAIGMRAIHFCHARAADPNPSEKETISSLPQLLPLINGIISDKSDNYGNP